MNNKAPALGFWVTLFIPWCLPLYGVIYNQFYPSYESALGLPYLFLFGCLVHLVVLLLWVGIKRSKLQKSALIALLVSLCLMITLTVLSNAGWLSRFR